MQRSLFDGKTAQGTWRSVAQQHASYSCSRAFKLLPYSTFGRGLPFFEFTGSYCYASTPSLPRFTDTELLLLNNAYGDPGLISERSRTNLKHFYSLASLVISGLLYVKVSSGHLSGNLDV
jgi:hypothetical protein